MFKKKHCRLNKKFSLIPQTHSPDVIAAYHLVGSFLDISQNIKNHTSIKSIFKCFTVGESESFIKIAS